MYINTTCCWALRSSFLETNANCFPIKLTSELHNARPPFTLLNNHHQLRHSLPQMPSLIRILDKHRMHFGMSLGIWRKKKITEFTSPWRVRERLTHHLVKKWQSIIRPRDTTPEQSRPTSHISDEGKNNNTQLDIHKKNTHTQNTKTHSIDCVWNKNEPPTLY